MSNVLLISIDTCRADHLSCYGFNQETTPHIDKIASEGIRFERAYAVSPMTLPSHSSIMTGTLPPYHGARTNTQSTLSSANVTLAEILRDHGLTTGAIVSAFVLDSQFGMDQGFETYHDQFKSLGSSESMTQRSGGEVTQHALSWLRRNGQSPFFLLLHYYDPHYSYSPPDPFRSRFPNNAYAGEIAYADHCIGDVVEALKQMGLYDSTIIIITSDHGESLGEHEERTHGYFVYQSTIHVPLIFRIPGYNEPRTFDRAVATIDIMPTILGLLNIEIPNDVHGIDLTNDITGGDESPPRHRTFFSEALEPMAYGLSPLQSVIEDNWKYIHSPAPELYNLADDPKENTNLFDSRNEKAGFLKQRLEDVVERHTRTHLPTRQKSVDSQTIAKLAALGYISTHAKTASTSDVVAPKDFYPAYRKFMSAKARQNENDLVSARALAEQLSTQYPDQTAFRSLLCQIAQEQSDIKAALDVCHEVLRLDSEVAEAHHSLAKAYLAMGDDSSAADYFKRSIERRPFNTNFQMDYALFLAGRKKFKEAEAVFLNILKYDSDNTSVITNLAGCLGQQGKYREAISRLSAALANNPDNQKANETMGRLLSTVGDVDGAIAHFRRAVYLDPESVDTILVYADYLEYVFMLDEAADMYKRALALSPEDDAIKRKLSTLQ